MEQLVLWQVEDPATGCVFPWFTHGFLEVLKTWDLSEKTILEYGGGKSTPWWATKALFVVCVEANAEYVQSITEDLSNRNLLSKAMVLSRISNEGTTDPAKVDYYINAPDGILIPKGYDIVIVDGIMRHECMMKGVEILEKTGGILIADNWQQDGFVCPASEELMKSYVGRKYIQPDHTDHDGNPWCTAYWEIGKKMPDAFQVTCDYDSHRPMLWMALEHTDGLVVELGCGFGSTPVLYEHCLSFRPFVSFETNPSWAVEKLMEGIVCPVKSYHEIETDDPISILFIDSAPGEERALLADEYRNKAQILIVHDTEPGAEAVYRIQETLASFPYRCDLVVPGYPQTTAVSMTYDFKDWKGACIGQYLFT